MSRRPLLCALALAIALAVPATAHAGEPAQLYVSLGDSYATGYQPTGVGQGRATRQGFANQLPGLARRRGWNLRLVNFGCGGATTTSIVRSGCVPAARAIGGAPYRGRTQLQAAERFIRRNRERVGLITVSIGGNDVTSCARGAADPVACVATAVRGIRTNVSAVARRLRRAAGPRTRIVGTTYPNVILGRWLTGQQADQDLARLSVVAFRSLINPALRESYAKGRARFVDVTRLTDAYAPFEQTASIAPYGEIPVAVARVCELTWFCQYGDIHARASGYRVIASLIANTLPRRS
jgi:lysophospholipase L1-like esterase